MRIYENIKAAENMGLHRSYAIQKRMAFLTEKKLEIGELIEWWTGMFLKEWASEIDEEFCFSVVCSLMDENSKIEKEIEVVKRMTGQPTSEIDDAMIESARRVPVDRIVEFKRRKATAWCHMDKNPSLVLLDRLGIAWCPVCDKKFDAIGVLMTRDGMDFKDAVKELS